MVIASKSLKHILKFCLNLSNSRLQRLMIMIMLAFIIVLAACGSESVIELPIALEPGQLARGEDEFGTFYTYVPTTIPEDVEILVVIHGTPLKDQTEEWNAEYYATNWLDFAEEQSFVLVVPVFNQKDFSSRLGDHALSGYRGLFGREIGADEWVLRLADMATFAEANGLTSHFTIDIIAGKGHTMSGLIAFSQKGFGLGTRQRKLIA